MTVGNPGELEKVDTEATDFALFSGGNDSVVSTHIAHREYQIDHTVYLDTNTGIDENLDHVKSVCDRYGWDLIVLESPVTLKEFALGTDTRQALGFPGPGIHSWAYQYFKERQLRAIASHTDNRPTFYTGVRKFESDNRMKSVTAETQESDRWNWVAPIHNWRDHQVDEYRENHDLPKNPVAEKIGRSGDCYCGSYAHRNSELAELEAHYPDHAEWIREIEKQVQQEIETHEDYCYWGFGGLSEKELRAKMAKDDVNQMSLCSSCDIPNDTEQNNEQWL